MAVLPTGRGRLDSCGSSCQITIRSISSTDLLRVLKGTPVGQDAVIPVARKVVAPGASTDATRATRRSSTVARGSANSRAGATRRRREPRRAPRRRLPPRASGHLPTGYRPTRRRRSLRGRRRRAVADAPSAPKSVTGCASDSTPGWPVPAVPDPAERPLNAGHRQGGRGEPGAGGPRPCRSRRTAGAAVSGAPARPAGHRPLNIRSGRRHGSPPVSRSQGGARRHRAAYADVPRPAPNGAAGLLRWWRCRRGRRFP